MAHTTDITEGIKWIKVNKTDVEGLVNTDNLQEVETLNLKFSDLGIQSFNVVSISERADYFLIHVDPNNIFETKSIASLLSVNDIEEGPFSGGKYVITPGASATFLDYSIDSLQSASLNTTTGEISTFFPLQTTVEIQVVASQSSSGDAGNVLFAQLEQDGTVTKSVGLGEFESFGVWETKSAVLEVDLELNGNNKIDTFIPRILANGTNSNVVALRSSGTNVIVKQPIVNIENNHIIDERLEAEGLASQVFTLGKDDDAQIENFTASIGTIDDGTFYNLSRPNNFGALSFTASIDVKQGASSTGTGFFTGSILSNGGSGDNNTLGRVFFDVTAASYTTLTWSGSYFITDISEDISMKLFSGDGSGNRDIDYRNPQLEINPVSPAKDGGETLTIIEPYVSEGNFSNSDCNPIINNTDKARVNEFYMDVDYSSDAIVAVNSDTILNGSATRANVQYSNYTTARITRPRYEGSRNTSPDINELDGSQLPVIEQTKGFFLYNRGGNFNTIADRSGSALYNIGFMIDDQGRTYEPQESESAYMPNLLSAFGQGSKVTFVPTDTGSQVAGTYDVHFPARKIKPIIYSDTGSLGNNYLVSGSYSTIEFIPDPSQYDQFNTYVVNYSGIVVSSNSSKRYEPNDVLNDQASGWGYDSQGNLQYYVSQSSNVLADIEVALTCSNAATGTFAAKLYKSGSSTPISTDSVSRGSTGNFNLGMTKTVKLQEGDSYYVEVENTSSANLTIRQWNLITYLTRFSIAPLTSTISVNTSDSWLTGSSNTTSVITASQDLAKAYNYVQANIPDSGFQFPILFTLQQYDEIRYDGDEGKVKLIDRVDYEVDVTADPTEFNLHVHFTEPVDMSTIDKDYYVFRRNEFQKDTMIVNTPGPLMEKGFILPEFQTPELKNNLSDIVQDLTDKGLISND